MGTPQFSVPSLAALHANGHDVKLVVCQPDRPKGRGRRVTPAPIKLAALNLGDEVIQPISIKTTDFFNRIEQIKPDFLVVIAFGHILPENLLRLPRLGAVNIHASLLPKYRGPAPVHWAIINGEKETGVCSMLMDSGQDTGDILLSAVEPIRPDDTAGTLYDRLSHKSAVVLIDTLNALAANTVKPTPQDHRLASTAPRLSKNDGRIDWEKTAESLETFIRGVTPWPGAFTFYGDIRFKIFKTRPIRVDITKPPGTILKGFPDELRVATGKGALCLEEIQGPSGKRLLIKDFLRGFHLAPGTVLG
jgi:methionyl-tRNA formyltransferase